MKNRLAVILPIYLAMYIACYYTAVLLRFDFRFPSNFIDRFNLVLPIFIATKLMGCLIAGEWRRSFRYGTMQDVSYGVVGTTLATAAIMVMNAVTVDYRIPRSVIAIDWALTTIALGGLRVSFRLYTELLRPVFTRPSGGQLSLVYSTGREAFEILRAIQGSNDKYKIVGLIDPKLTQKRSLIAGVQVYPLSYGWSKIVGQTNARHVLIPSSVSGSRLRQIVQECKQLRLATHVIPAMNDMLGGRYRLRVRDVTITDLLRREPTQLDQKSILGCVSGKRVMVTGAAGSIGSELCRQILQVRPQSLICVDQSEFGVYSIAREIEQNGPMGVAFEFSVLDVTDSNSMNRLMAQHRPHLVFHAAAYKHVPLMERNPESAIRNNVLGTKIIADAAAEFGVERFVLISTDKAVRPASIMGSTKFLAEKYIQAAATVHSTQFITVRFGNVLNSTGSVVPLFSAQIEAGGPVTVTHPDMKRFFMTIPEAVQLVLQAGAIGESGDLLILDMGKPIRIVDLAKDMIALSGLRYPEDIDIVYQGMRPGERLDEELFYSSEQKSQTHKVHDKIHCASRSAPDWKTVVFELARLEAALKGTSSHDPVEVLKAITERYVSDAAAPDNELRAAA